MSEEGAMSADRVMSKKRVTTGETLTLIGRSLHFVWPYWPQILIKLILSFFGIALILFLPWPLKFLIDYVVMGLPVGSSPTPIPPYIQPLVELMNGMTPLEIVWVVITFSLLGITLIGSFGIGISRDTADGNLAQGLDTATQSENLANESSSRVSGLLGLFEYRFQLKTTHRFNHQLRSLVFRRLLALPMTRFSDDSVGDAVYRVMYDTPAISKICYDILVVPICNLFLIATVIWTMQYSFSAVPSLVLLAWLAAPMILISSFLVTGVARRRSLASREAGADTTATVEEGMSNILAVQSLGAHDRQRDEFDRDSKKSFSRYRSSVWINVMLVGLQATVACGLLIYVFFDIAEAIIAGKMTPGDSGILWAYFGQLLLTTVALGALWFKLQDNLVGMRRVFQIIDHPTDHERHGHETLETVREGLRFEHVSYAYPDGTPALSDITLDARVGEMVALVGATGSGKTTLSYLIPAFIQPTEGRVLLDGIDTRTLAVENLRELVSFVFQEPAVFDDTVANNIRLGNPCASDAELESAAATAGALPFIRNLPEGFETRLGRNGDTLSVGQKQRLAIARGLVSRSKVLVLDEPTAALDPETENALVRALQAEREKRVLIVIAHRLSTIRTADRICVVDNGKIVESGSHEELMQNPTGAYRQFVEIQLTSLEDS
jgi:ABC-type multidrug transport system fused ATPase/permease subunit